jgi:membrane protease YdiL (CAAX protease family)
MERRRIAKALALLPLGAVAGLATSHLSLAGGASPAESLALQSLGVEIFLVSVAVAGATLGPAPPGVRLGLAPSALGWRWQALLVLGAIASSYGLDGVLEISGLREHSVLAQLDGTLAGVRGRALLLALVGIGLAPGIAEELLCRGLVQRSLEARLGPALAVPLAALFFGALHGDRVHAAFASVLGLYLGLAAQLAGSVRVAIACHAINNLLAVAVAAIWPGLELVTGASTAAGFGVALACLWAVKRRAAVAAPPPFA